MAVRRSSRRSRPGRRFGNAHALDERTISEAFRRHYKATGSKTDAWNMTLDEVAGPAPSDNRLAVANILRVVSERIASSMRSKVPHQTVLLDVHPLDVWGNRRDGFEVNDVWPSRGQIEIPVDATHQEIMTALKRGGFVDRNIHLKSIEIDGEPEFGLSIGEARTSKPVYQLRVASEKKEYRPDMVTIMAEADARKRRNRR
jgi:hypothetical protein